MVKEGIWKILLRNDRLQKSRVRRIKKRLEHLNKVGCLKPVVPVLFCFSRVGGWAGGIPNLLFWCTLAMFATLFLVFY